MKLTFFVTNFMGTKKKHALQSEVRTSLPLQNMPLSLWFILSVFCKYYVKFFSHFFIYLNALDIHFQKFHLMQHILNLCLHPGAGAGHIHACLRHGL